MIGGPIKVPPKPKRRMGNKDIGGEYPNEFGHIVREPNTDYTAKSLQARQRARELQQRERAAQRRSALAAQAQLDLEVVADQRLHMARARANLAIALRAADADLDRRRHRLQEMLRCENAALATELVRRAQQAPQERLQRSRTKEYMLKAQREAEREQRAEEMRLVQYRNRYVELRALEKKRLNAITRDSQIYQMHEKMWLRQKAKEEDSFWQEVIRKNQAALAEQEEQEERASKSRALEMALSYKADMEARGRVAADERMRANQEAAVMHALVARAIEEGDVEGAGKRKKQEELRHALDAQRTRQHAVRCDLEAAERRFDLAQALWARAQTEQQDLSAVIKEEKHRQEVHTYLEYKRAEKRMQLQREREAEAVMREVAERANTAREERLRALEDEKRRRQQEAQLGLLEQLEERRALAREAAAEEAAEAERLEAARLENVRLHEEYERRENERALRHARDLLEQQQYAATLKEREQRLDRERLEQGRLEEEKLQRRVRQLFDRHYPYTINSLQAAALMHPPPDVAQPMPPPAKPPRPCDEATQAATAKAEEKAKAEAVAQAATRGMEGVMAAAQAASARQRSPERRPAPHDAAGVGACHGCGGYRVFTPCLSCAEPCAEAAFSAARATHWQQHDKAGPTSVSAPWGAWLEQQRGRWDGLGAVPPPEWPPPPPPSQRPNCHAPPHAQPGLPNPYACVGSLGRSTGRGAAPDVAPPQQRCYMCR